MGIFCPRVTDYDQTVGSSQIGTSQGSLRRRVGSDVHAILPTLLFLVSLLMRHSLALDARWAD